MTLGTFFLAFYGKQAAIIKEAKASGLDLVTSRIMWLRGLDKNVNLGGKRDSFNRAIYIHGTNEEGLIGKPASHGCVRMKNADIIALFPKVKLQTKVMILSTP